uniref:SHSP domain-containing protein n=1 Tax=Rhizophora mucronata TaxID=61149 RepID=A0A2P2Q2U1_RHIMU
MMDTMERIIEDPFAYSSTWPSVSTSGYNGYSRGRTPWAIKEGENDYKMRFDMPGMTKDDVKVWMEQQMLVLEAEKVPSKKALQESDVKFDDSIGDDEWPIPSYGKYNFRIALPEKTDYEKIKAEVKDGVLYITIPKTSTSGEVMNINVQ